MEKKHWVAALAAICIIIVLSVFAISSLSRRDQDLRSKGIVRAEFDSLKKIFSLAQSSPELDEGKTRASLLIFLIFITDLISIGALTIYLVKRRRNED